MHTVEMWCWRQKLKSTFWKLLCTSKIKYCKLKYVLIIKLVRWIRRPQTNANWIKNSSNWASCLHGEWERERESCAQLKGELLNRVEGNSKKFKPKFFFLSCFLCCYERIKRFAIFTAGIVSSNGCCCYFFLFKKMDEIRMTKLENDIHDDVSWLTGSRHCSFGITLVVIYKN